MKQALVWAAALGLLGASTVAQAAPNNPPIIWQGAVTVTAVQGQCVGEMNKTFQFGQTGISVFRPRLDPAEEPSGLTMIFARSAFAFYRISGGGVQYHGTGQSRGIKIGIYATPSVVISGGGVQFQPLHISHTFAITPATITKNTLSVRIVGYVSFHSPGCTVYFTGNYSLLPAKQTIN